MTREVITRKDIVKIFASHNNYIMGFSADSKEDDYVAQNDIDEIVRAINSAYRVSKLNFIWKKKLDENKKTMSSQLNGVSEALSNLANQITKDEDDIYKAQKEQVKKQGVGFADSLFFAIIRPAAPPTGSAAARYPPSAPAVPCPVREALSAARSPGR